MVTQIAASLCSCHTRGCTTGRLDVVDHLSTFLSPALLVFYSENTEQIRFDRGIPTNKPMNSATVQVPVVHAQLQTAAEVVAHPVSYDIVALCILTPTLS